MKDIKPIIGGINIHSKAGSVKQKDALAKPLGMFGFGFNKAVAKNLSATTTVATATVPQDLVDKFSGIEVPTRKPTQLTIDDKYYIPDREFEDADV